MQFRTGSCGGGPQAVGAADGTAAFCVDPGGREADLAGVAAGMSSAVPEEMFAARGRRRLRYIRS